MTSRHRDSARAAVVVLALSGAVTACATTVDEQPTGQPLPPGAVLADQDTTPIEGGTIIDTAPTTTPVAGPATELLPELAIEMSRLGSEIANGEGDDATLARIEAIWIEVRPELETTHPELVNGIGAMVDMARTAVERTRPADADKAFSVLTDLVDKFTGDG